MERVYRNDRGPQREARRGIDTGQLLIDTKNPRSRALPSGILAGKTGFVFC